MIIKILIINFIYIIWFIKLIRKNIIINKLFITNLINIHLKLNIINIGIDNKLNIIIIRLILLYNDNILIWLMKLNLLKFKNIINMIFNNKYIVKNLDHNLKLKFNILMIQKILLIERLNIINFKLFILNIIIVINIIK